jgi:hypothetical protein
MSNTYHILEKLVDSAECLPGWVFSLGEGEDNSKVLLITISGTNNYDRSQKFTVTHCHPVPCTTYNEATWKRWIFDQCVRSMNHELGESLKFDGNRPFAPMHGPGEDPYTVHEYRPEIDFLTTQSGAKREGPI